MRSAMQVIACSRSTPPQLHTTQYSTIDVWSRFDSHSSHFNQSYSTHFSTPLQTISLMETNNHTPVSGIQIRNIFSFPGPKSLDCIVQLNKFEKLDIQGIQDLWLEYHKQGVDTVAGL